MNGVGKTEERRSMVIWRR